MRWPAAPPADRPGVWLVVHAAVAAHRLTPADVADWRGDERTDADLTRLLAVGAIAAVDRIEAGILAPRLQPAV